MTILEIRCNKFTFSICRSAEQYTLPHNKEASPAIFYDDFSADCWRAILQYDTAGDCCILRDDGEGHKEQKNEQSSWIATVHLLQPNA